MCAAIYAKKEMGVSDKLAQDSKETANNVREVLEVLNVDKEE